MDSAKQLKKLPYLPVYLLLQMQIPVLERERCVQKLFGIIFNLEHPVYI
jgi:hypothetical protein